MERRGKDGEGGRQFCFQQTVCTEYRVRVSEAEEATTYALNRARRRVVSAPDQLTDDKFLRKKERCL